MCLVDEDEKRNEKPKKSERQKNMGIDANKSLVQ